MLPTHKFATLKDVAELAGTSAATVSYILSGSTKRYVSEEMRKRVEDAAATLGYVKFGAASTLKGKKSGVIAILSPQYENPYFASIFATVESIVQEHGYVLATLNTFDDPEREKHAINQMVRLRVDGFLVIPTLGGGVNTETIRNLNVPFVAVERPLTDVPDNTYNFISSDNLGAVYALTKHSLQNGHRRIALAYWQSEVTSAIVNLTDRRLGYEKAMHENNAFAADLMFSGDITQEDGARITEGILRDKSVTSIVYAHYILAEGGIRYLQKNGLRAPRDISISFLGSPAWVDMVDTDYTRALQPGEAVGRMAVETLLARINGSGGRDVVEVVPVRLHVGESVGYDNKR